MQRIEGGLHYLSPLTTMVNSMGARVGAGPFSEREVLFTLWTILEVRCEKGGAGYMGLVLIQFETVQSFLQSLLTLLEFLPFNKGV